MRVRDKQKTTAKATPDRPTRDAASTGGRAALARRRIPPLRSIVTASPWYLAPAVVTYAATLPLFAPWSIWPLGYVAFVPWLVLVCVAGSAAGAYATSYLLGAGFFFTHWWWLYETTPPGYIVGSAAFALYFCLAAWLVRHLYLRRRIPVTFAFPVVWILVEMMRSRGSLAFPWFLLGHSQIRLLSVVQIADITGVYGVSFAVAMVNGLFADLLLRKFQQVGWALPTIPTAPTNGGQSPPYGLWPAAPVAVVCVLGGVLGYGWWRLATLPTAPGPIVAVLQGDFLLKAEEDPNAPTDTDKQAVYLSLLNAAGAQRPDLIVLPETPWGMYLNRELRELTHAALADLSSAQRRIYNWLIRNNREWNAHFLAAAQRHQATVVVGAMSQEKQPAGTYPAEHRYNSAFVFSPKGGEAGRYDKIHLVMFGEFVPFRYTIPAVYWWINGLTPWGQGGYEYSLTSGSEFRVFSLPIADFQWPMDQAGARESIDHRKATNDPTPRRFGITICYEDVIPQVFRRFILDPDGGKRVDFMLNISNDGWFGHGAQQAQHLVNCAFRAIENRVGIARSVNTGVSGFVRPDGSWHHLITADAKWPTAGGTGHQVAPIESSPVITFYARFGDLFGVGVTLVGCAAVIDAIVARRREKRRPPEASHTHV